MSVTIACQGFPADVATPRSATRLATAYEALKRRYPPERFTEFVLNGIGYEMLRAGRTEEAVAVFELNVEEYPEAWNAHDSLGDAYVVAGQSEKAAELREVHRVEFEQSLCEEGARVEVGGQAERADNQTSGS